MTAEQFDLAERIATEHLNAQDKVYCFEGFAGADPTYRLGVRVVTEQAWHNLFASTLFIRQGTRAASGSTDWKHDLVAITAAEVAEGIVGAHKHALPLGHAVQNTLAIGIQLGEFSQQCRRIRLEGGLAPGIVLDQTIADDLDRPGPRRRVHPDVRVVLALQVFGLHEVLLVDQLGHGMHAAIARGGAHERVGHELNDYLDDIEDAASGRPILTLCHHGVRSIKAALALRGCGFEQSHSIAGGIENWSLAVDQSVPRYTREGAICTLVE